MRQTSQKQWVHQPNLFGWHWEQHSRVPLRRKPPQGRSSLIIKEKLGTSDRETVEQIKENPYLQYFIGMSSYSNEAPFEASTMVDFRERIEMNLVKKINRKMVKNFIEKKESESEEEKKRRNRNSTNKQ